MSLNKYTSLTRSIDLSYNTNLIITIIFFTIFIGSFLFFDYTVTEGLANGLLIFILWALAREIDVPHDWSAFIALPVALYMIYLGVSFSLMFLFTILITSRLFSKTNEVKIMNSDYILVVILWTITIFSGFTSIVGSINYLFMMLLGILFYSLVNKIFKLDA